MSIPNFLFIDHQQMQRKSKRKDTARNFITPDFAHETCSQKQFWVFEWRFIILGITVVRFHIYEVSLIPPASVFQRASFWNYQKTILDTLVTSATKKNKLFRKKISTINKKCLDFSAVQNYKLIAKLWRWQTLKLPGRIVWVRKMKFE